MLSMSISDLAAATGAALLCEGSGHVSGEVVIDSRKAGSGAVFVAFAGEKVDGNSYALGAVEAGAGAVVLSANPADGLLDAAREHGCAVLRAEADDCEEFLLRLAGEWVRRHPQWLVVGVTGSVGKTTTKDMLRAGISSQRRCHATAGNFNNLIGMPLTVLSAPEDTEVLVLELGMNHPHEIDRLVAACHPAAACITNVGTSHIGLLGSRENIARAKGEVCSGMRSNQGVGPVLAMMASGDFTSFIDSTFAEPAGVRVIKTSVAESASSIPAGELGAYGVRLTEDGCATFTVVAPSGWSREVTLSVPGRHVVEDFTLALDLCDVLGLDLDKATDAIAAMPATRMRLSVIRTPGKPTVIDDSYNASPSSMAAALDVLCEMRCEGRRIAVLGEIGELGAEEERLHDLVGAYAAAKPLDELVLVGGAMAGRMAEAARVMGFSDDHINTLATPDDAVALLLAICDENDVILAKASRSAGLDAVVRGVLG